jgi:replicative DNA helicase
MENENIVNLMNQKGNFRSQPFNLEAEQAILGSFLNNNENINKVGDFLFPNHFYLPVHKKIYEAILNYNEKGIIANPITLKNLFDKNDDISGLGFSGVEYLLKLATNASTIINLNSYAKEVYELSLRRNLIDIGENVVNDAYDNFELDSVRLIEKTEGKLFSLATEGFSEKGFTPLKTSIIESLKRIDIARKRGGEVNGTTTGFIDLDTMLGGLQNSDLLILAARPSMGKTSLAINIALNAAISFLNDKTNEKPKSVGFFSLEMSGEQIANRLLAIKTGINGSKIRVGNISKDEFLTLVKESENLNTIPLYIDDTPARTISSVRTLARRLKRQNNLGLIVIDYLQLLRSSGANEGNRVQEIGEISQGLKAIAKELDIPVIALSQLSRAVESREDKRPQLSDLRESGNIEQDADVVMFIYREEYYLSRKMPQIGSDSYQQWQEEMEKAKSIAEVIIAKQRNGPIGNVSLRFDTVTTGFGNFEKNAMTIMAA